MTKLHVQVITPDGLVFDGEAGFVLARTTDGEMGVLPNHLPIIVPLAINSLQIKEKMSGNVLCTIAVNGGFLEVRDNKVSVLAYSAEQSEEIDIERAQLAKTRAEKSLEEAKEEHDTDNLKRAEVALNRAINRIHVSRK